MKKKLSLLLAFALLVACLIGCNGGSPDSSAPSSPSSDTSSQPKTTVHIGTIMGPTGVGMVQLMEENQADRTANQYDFLVASGPEEVKTKLLSGDLDIAAIPTNMAAALYKKTEGKIRLLAVNTLGVLYFLENGQTISSIEDLRGKTIYSTGQGANPEYILRYLLSSNGIDPDKDVTLNFLTENEELAAALVKGTASVALVPEPLATTVLSKKEGLRVALDVNELWTAAAGENSHLMMGCVAVRNDFATANPQAVKDFLTEYQTSAQATSDVAATAQRCVTYGIIANAAVAESAIPRCRVTFLKAADAKQALNNYFTVLFNANSSSIGGAMPDDGFYYENP